MITGGEITRVLLLSFSAFCNGCDCEEECALSGGLHPLHHCLPLQQMHPVDYPVQNQEGVVSQTRGERGGENLFCQLLDAKECRHSMQVCACSNIHSMFYGMFITELNY